LEAIDSSVNLYWSERGGCREGKLEWGWHYCGWWW